jgi:hypothetical protein
MDQQIAIDNIKRLMNRDNQSGQQMQLQAGDGISVSQFMNGYSISALQNEQDPPKAPNVYTLQICVNGKPKNIDVLISKEPY